MGNPAAATTFLMQGPQAQSVVANLSTTMRVNTLAYEEDLFSYVGNPPKAALQNIDYTSHTWGLQTKCKPVTSQCIDEASISGVRLKYKCPFAMEGTISTEAGTAFQNQYLMTYFEDSTASSNSTLSVNLANPYYFGAISLVNQNIGHNPAMTDDPEITSTGHGAEVFALFCNTTVYDVEYTSINGSITRFNAAPANSTLTNIVQGTSSTPTWETQTSFKVLLLPLWSATTHRQWQTISPRLTVISHSESRQQPSLPRLPYKLNVVRLC